MLLQHLAHKRQIQIENRGAQWLGGLEAFHFNGAPYGVGVDVQSGCNRADFPMLGVEIAANLYAGFGTDHQSHLRRGICGKGSTKRPARPQIEQRSQRLDRFSSPPGSSDGSETATGIVIVSPQPNGAGEMPEREP